MKMGIILVVMEFNRDQLYTIIKGKAMATGAYKKLKEIMERRGGLNGLEKSN